MSNHPELAALQRNLQLKQFFAQRGLDPGEVIQFAKYKLDWENAQMEALMEFVEVYEHYGSRMLMEMMAPADEDDLYPPILPLLSPNQAWLKFEMWMRGEPTKSTLAEMLPGKPTFRKPEELSEEEVETELNRLIEAIKSASMEVFIPEDLPARLKYGCLYSELGNKFHLGLDVDSLREVTGCINICPMCVQRPWCEYGYNEYWHEDELEGKMQLPPELAPYVSVSPYSLEIMRKEKAEEDAKQAESMASAPDAESLKRAMENWVVKYN